MRSAASLYRRTLAVIIRAAESQIMAVEERRPAAGACFGDGISVAAGGVGDIAKHTFPLWVLPERTAVTAESAALVFL